MCLLWISRTKMGLKNNIFIQDENCSPLIFFDTSSSSVERKVHPTLQSLDCTSYKVDDSRSKLGELTAKLLKEYSKSQRLVFGVQSCIWQLERRFKSVFVCILPADQTSEQDVSGHIVGMLLKAFCWENSIPLLTVDKGDKIYQLLGLTIEPDLCSTSPCVVVLKKKWEIAMDMEEHDFVTKLEEYEELLLGPIALPG